jgi:hypothetical protein
MGWKKIRRCKLFFLQQSSSFFYDVLTHSQLGDHLCQGLVTHRPPPPFSDQEVELPQLKRGGHQRRQGFLQWQLKWLVQQWPHAMSATATTQAVSSTATAQMMSTTAASCYECHSNNSSSEFNSDSSNDEYNSNLMLWVPQQQLQFKQWVQQWQLRWWVQQLPHAMSAFLTIFSSYQRYLLGGPL